VLRRHEPEEWDARRKNGPEMPCFLRQSNLLGSIVALPSLALSMETVHVLLDILIVTHLAVEESGQVLEIVSEEQQA
jgi:hypothetical protein